VHSLFILSRTKTIADIVKAMKEDCSQWMKKQGLDYNIFSWQRGYGAFSVSQSKVNAVKAYIANQAEHHSQISFRDEFRQLLKKHYVEWDEQYVWD
jgi:REP element-mobilizing transposase RayT